MLMKPISIHAYIMKLIFLTDVVDEFLKKSNLLLLFFDVVRNEFLFAENIVKDAVLFDGL